MLHSIKISGHTNTPPWFASNISIMSMANRTVEESRCLLCQQQHYDVRIASCGCSLHSTCLPLDIYFQSACMNNEIICPSCHTPAISISLLPLPAAAFEKAFLSREQCDESPNAKSTSLVLSSPSERKRAAVNKSAMNRTCRTGRWSSEESALVDRLIKSFDAGLLPLPHGIKLNDFLCDLLSCRTSRLTKKLKHEKLSSRSYRSIGECSVVRSNSMTGVSMLLQAGSSIQRAQTLFLRTISPPWLQMELRLNIMRVWRTQLANLCLQVGFHRLDTTDWASSLNAVEQICSDDSVEAKRRRLKHALSQDASAVISSSTALNKVGLSISTSPHQKSQRERFESMSGSITRESETCLGSHRKFTFGEDEMRLDGSMHEVSSFASLAALLTTPIASRRQSDAGSEIIEDFVPNDKLTAGLLLDDKLIQTPSAEQTVDGVIDSVVEKAFTGGENHGKFLQKVSEYLCSSDANFQHIDLWVPTEKNVVLGKSQIILTNAGHVTVRSGKVPPHVSKRLQEFGVYSTTFAFTPGIGLEGLVFSSNRPVWMNKLSQAKPEDFSRVGGAKVYGISTAVGLPIATSIGTIVAVLYSTSDLTRDSNLETQYMDYFLQLRPMPRWRLCIDIASNEMEDQPSFQRSGSSYDPRNSLPCIVPSSPVSDFSDQTTSSLNEQSLALILGKCESLVQSDTSASNATSLRLLLLRHPSCRTTVETSQVCTIMNKYRSYSMAKYSESDIVRLVASDWSSLAHENMALASTTAHSRITSDEIYQDYAPNADLFGFTQTSEAPNGSKKKSGLEPRVVSDPTFQFEDDVPL